MSAGNAFKRHRDQRYPETKKPTKKSYERNIKGKDEELPGK